MIPVQTIVIDPDVSKFIFILVYREQTFIELYFILFVLWACVGLQLIDVIYVFRQWFLLRLY